MAATARKFVQLISTAYLKERTVIDDNVDDKLLKQAVIDAQEMQMQRILGYNLYTKIMSDIYDEVLTDPYEILVRDYIKPAQAQFAFYNVIPYINYKITNKNVAERNSDNSNPAELKVIAYLRDDANNKAEYYAQRITEFIKNNQNTYPEYYYNNSINAITPAGNSYFCGMQLPDYQHSYYGPGDSIDLLK